MDAFTTFCSFALPITLAYAVFATVRLQATRQALTRTMRRMKRLDAIADQVALREFETSTLEADSDSWLRDSGELNPIGLALDSENWLEEDEFVPPTMSMSRHVQPPEAPSRARQTPSREQHMTPMGLPRGLAARSEDDFVSVGSISVRSDCFDPLPRKQK